MKIDKTTCGGLSRAIGSFWIGDEDVTEIVQYFLQNGVLDYGDVFKRNPGWDPGTCRLCGRRVAKIEEHYSQCHLAKLTA